MPFPPPFLACGRFFLSFKSSLSVCTRTPCARMRRQRQQEPEGGGKAWLPQQTQSLSFRHSFPYPRLFSPFSLPQSSVLPFCYSHIALLSFLFFCSSPPLLLCFHLAVSPSLRFVLQQFPSPPLSLVFSLFSPCSFFFCSRCFVSQRPHVVAFGLARTAFLLLLAGHPLHLICFPHPPIARVLPLPQGVSRVFRYSILRPPPPLTRLFTSSLIPPPSQTRELPSSSIPYIYTYVLIAPSPSPTLRCRGGFT